MAGASLAAVHALPDPHDDRPPGAARPPSIGVCLPARDAAATIGRALASVHDQRVPAQQVVVIDDGSTDDTAERAAAWGAEVATTAPRGVAAARNAGLCRLRTDYVAFLDADDAWPEDYLATVRSHLLATSPQLLLAGRHEVDEQHRLQRRRRVPSRPPTLFDVLCRGAVTTSGVVADRLAVEQVGGFDEQLPFAEDTDLWVRLLQAGATVDVAATWCWYTVRQRPESAEHLRYAEWSRRRVLDKLAGTGTVDDRKLARIAAWRTVSLGLRYLRAGRRRDALRCAFAGWRCPAAAGLATLALLPGSIHELVARTRHAAHQRGPVSP